MAKSRRTFGSVEELPSKRYRARYTGPDGLKYTAPITFDTKTDADAWLTLRRAEIVSRAWRPPEAEAPPEVLFVEYAEQWLSLREHKPKTRAQYRLILDSHLIPAFGDLPLTSITSAGVRAWYAETLRDKPAMRAHCYSLLRTIMRAAVDDEHISVSPCKIVGAGATRRAKRIEPATLEELAATVQGMPERLRLAVILAAWCALRFGEVSALRRQDVDLKNQALHIRQAATYTPEVGRIVQSPKTSAGTRNVSIPPHLMPLVREHLRDHTAAERTALLFPSTRDVSKPIASSSMHWHFDRATSAAGRKDLSFHALRHTGAVLAASTGATLAELMDRLGHDSPAAALRYQHAAKGRDSEIARLLSGLVTPAATPNEKD